ncbi:heparan-alpha-glucosaminide N-acetyltransferase-like [Haliotis rufescens]|uniref:heparan-alpha-glucosaminide N-acetyltransferase-like n=1 Tax=Haliotis rufescens TaxID=6454 RepID=UPI00201E82D6|nr:heparan-alpha-glucosaminide N-acetyltransferase-like [Haliotis rufescens]
MNTSTYMRIHPKLFQLVLISLFVSAALSQETTSATVTTTQSGNSSRWDFIRYFNAHRSDEKPDLTYDKAWFTINTSVNFDLQLWAQTTQCLRCPLRQIDTIHGPNTSTILIDTKWPMRVKLARQHPTDHVEDICSFELHYREAGDYWLFLDYQAYIEGTACDLLLANEPLPAEIPILFTVLGLLGLAGLWAIIKCIYRRSRSAPCFGKSADITDPREHSEANNSVNMDPLSKANGDVENGGPTKVTELKKKKRLRSLDTFRGLSLSVMIFVNYGGGGYWFFEHPPWNGLTLADLVFPWFIFIMGTAMNFSFRSMYKRGKTRCQIFWKIIKRSCILFGLGIILATSWGPTDLTKLRVPGVLQRFGVTYLIIALTELVCHRKEDSHADRKWSAIRDIVLYLPAWVFHLCLLAAYLGLTFGLPVPGCPTGYIGPGGLSDGGKNYNCTGGAARHIDYVLLGNNHIYQFPTPQELYETQVPYDPEGILGVLTSVFLCFLGVQAGRIIITYQSHTGRIVRWLIWGVVTGAIAALLCKGSQNDGWIPINKNLWSVSFVLVTASFAFFLLSAMYVFMDIVHWWEGGPFVYPGMNSIVVYVGHDLLWRLFPINWEIEHIHWKLLLQDVWGAGIWCFIAYLMFRKKFFVAI